MCLTTQSPINGVNKPIISHVMASDCSLGNTGLTDVSPRQGLEKAEWGELWQATINWLLEWLLFYTVLLGWARFTNCCLELFFMGQNSCQWKSKWHELWIGVTQWPFRDTFLTDIDYLRSSSHLIGSELGRGEEMGGNQRTEYRNTVCWTLTKYNFAKIGNVLINIFTYIHREYDLESKSVVLFAVKK